MDMFGTATLIEIDRVVSPRIDKFNVDVITNPIGNERHWKGTDSIGAVEDKLRLIIVLGTPIRIDKVNEFEECIRKDVCRVIRCSDLIVELRRGLQTEI